MSENLELLKNADLSFNQQKFEDALVLYLKLADKAESDKDNSIFVQALGMAGRTCLPLNNLKKSREYIEKAEREVTKDDQDGYSRLMSAKGRLLWKEGKNEEATIVFAEMYDYCMDHKVYHRATDAAGMAAITGTPDQQINWAEKGIKAAEEGNQQGYLSRLWNNLGATYWDKATESEGEKEIDFNKQALDCYLKARDYHWKVGSEMNKLIADWAVGSAYRRINDLANAKAWLRPVLAWSERLYQINNTPDNGEWIAWSKYDLGLIADQEGDKRQALEFLKHAKELLEKAKIIEWDKKTYEKILSKVKELEDK